MSPTQLWMTGEHPHDSNDMSSQVYPSEVEIWLTINLKYDITSQIGQHIYSNQPGNDANIKPAVTKPSI